MSEDTSPLEQMNVFSKFILQFHILEVNVNKEDEVVNCLMFHF